MNKSTRKSSYVSTLEEAGIRVIDYVTWSLEGVRVWHGRDWTFVVGNYGEVAMKEEAIYDS